MDGILIAIRGRKLENGKIHKLLDLKMIIFNYGIAEDFVAGFVDLLAREFLVRAGRLDFKILAYVDRADFLVAHMRQGVLDRFPLRVEHGFFWSNNDFGFHSTKVTCCTHGGAGLMSNPDFLTCQKAN